MRSLLDDPPTLDDNDAVGIDHGRQAVSYHERGSTMQESCQRLLYDLFRLGIDAGGGFIQDQDAWICQERPGK